MGFRRDQIQDKQTPNKVLIIPADTTGTVALDTSERIVLATADTDDAYTIELPSPEEAVGLTFSISAAITASGAITVVATGLSNYTLDADGDAVLLYSDGIRYWELAEEVA